jgi:hypothetical protein
MKYTHTSLAEATQKTEELQQALDGPIYDLFFGPEKLESVRSSLSQRALEKAAQLGALRAQAQRLVTTLIYRVEYLSLPRNAQDDNEKQKETRQQNNKWRVEEGMSASQLRRYSRYSIDILLPLATEAVDETNKKWEEFKALLTPGTQL